MAPDSDHWVGESELIARSDPDCNDSCNAEQIDNPDFALVNEAALILTSTLQIEATFHRFAAKVASLVPFDRIAIHVVELSQGIDTVKWFAGRGLPSIHGGDARPLEGAAAHQVMLRQQTLVRSDLTYGPSCIRDREYLELGLRSAIIVGLESDNHFVGTLNLGCCIPNRYGARERNILETLATRIAPAVANSRLYETAKEETEWALAALDQTGAVRVGLEAELLQAQKMESLGQRVASVAHDFNNLLMAMLGFTALLEARLDPSSEAYEYSKMIETLANKGVDLTHRLLTSGRNGYAENKPVDLNGAVLEVVRILEPMLGENIYVDVQLQQDLPPVTGDIGQLQQAMINLCLNATDAMPNRGRIWLSTVEVYLGADFFQKDDSFAPGRYVRLKVANTGVGISEEHITKIFEPFFTTKEKERGTGLGLSVVLGVVTEHGGLVRVSSTLNQGSDFNLYLPAPNTT